MRHRLIGFASVLAAAFFAASGVASAAADLSPRTSTSDGVTVKAMPRAVSASAWEFEIVFDTHSQALADDLGKTAKLVDDSGTFHAPTSWQGDAPGGHHRKGTLRFDGVAPAPAYLELRIQRTGEKAPRVFRWPTK